MTTQVYTLGGLLLSGRDPETGVEWRPNPRRTRGWWGTSGTTLAATQKPRAAGAWVGQPYATAKHLTIGGLVVAPNEAALDGALDALVRAAPADEPILLTVAEGGRTRWTTVWREQPVDIEKVSTGAAEWDVQLLAPDPRKFGQTRVVSTRLPSSSGGLSVPFSVPFSIDAVSVSGQVSLTNPGNVAGPVRLRIDGPVTGPIVTHVSSGRALVFASSLVLAAGQWVEVDMERRTVLENGQASRNGWVTERGWSAFEPGVNVWSFTAAEHDPDSLLTVTAVDAWD